MLSAIEERVRWFGMVWQERAMLSGIEERLVLLVLRQVKKV